MADAAPAAPVPAQAPAAPKPSHLVQNVAMGTLSTTSALVILEWVVQPTWPPPVAVLTVAAGLMTPVVHVAGRGVMRKLAKWAGNGGDDEGAEPSQNGHAPAPAAPPAAAPAPQP